MKATDFLSRASLAICGILLAAAFALVQVLIGGTRLVFSLPAYGVLAAMSILALVLIGRARPQPNQLCLISTGIFVAYVLVRACTSPVDYLARPDIYSALACLLVYLFVACILTGAKHRSWFLFFLLVLAMVHVAIGALQFRDGTNFMPISFLQRFDYGRRASGFYVNPNHLAGLLEILGVFGLSIGFWGRSPVWLKLLMLYAAAVCYGGLIITGSRGGYFSAGASVITVAALSLIVLWRAGSTVFVRIGGATLIVAALVISVVLILARGSLFVSERTGQGGLENEGYNRRYDMWHAAAQEWQLQPIVGTGSGTYLFYGRQFRAESTNKDPVYTHNDYLQLLAEYGLIGAATFLLFLLSHLYAGWRNFQRLGPKRVIVSTRLFSNALALQIGALGAVAAIVVHSIVDFNLHIPANALLMAFVLGLLANPGVSHESQTPALTKSSIGWRIVAALVGIVVALQCVRLLPAEYFAERARVALRDGDPTTAASFAVRALKTEQKNPSIYYYLGRAGMLEGNAVDDPAKRAFLFQVASVAFEKGWALARQDEIFPAELAVIYDALERFPEAEWMYNEALRLDPNSVPLQQNYHAHLESWRRAPAAKPIDVDPGQE